MKWLWLLLLLPVAQACTLSAPPSGPGYLEAVAFNGDARLSAVIEERGLGGDCSIDVPMAIGNGIMAWQEGDVVHQMTLATGQTTQHTLPWRASAFAIDAQGLMAMRWQGTHPDNEYHLYTGTGEHIRQIEPGDMRGPRIFEEDGADVDLHDLRSGELLLAARPTAHPSLPMDDLSPVAADDRFVVYEAHGQGSQPTWVWDDERSSWRLLDLPEWVWAADVVDGWYHGVRQGTAYHVDLATGAVISRPGPDAQVLAITDGWFLTGAYQGTPGPQVLPGEGAPMAPWIVFGALAFAAGGPRPKS